MAGTGAGRTGIPTPGFAPGVEALAHTSRERLELASACLAFDACPAVIRTVQDALAGARRVRAHAIAPAEDTGVTVPSAVQAVPDLTSAIPFPMR